MDLGINYTKEYEDITLEESIDVVKNPSDEIIKLAKLNVAVLLYICKRVDSIEDTYKRLLEL